MSGGVTTVSPAASHIGGQVRVLERPRVENRRRDARLAQRVDEREMLRDAPVRSPPRRDEEAGNALARGDMAKR